MSVDAIMFPCNANGKRKVFAIAPVEGCTAERRAHAVSGVAQGARRPFVAPRCSRLLWALLFGASAGGEPPATPNAIDEVRIPRVKLLGVGEPRANNTVDAETLQAENPSVDVLGSISRLPGARVSQGDAIGGNDWSTRIYIRGMANSTDTAQIGYMVGALPNGDSVYGGGQKPSAYVDHENVAWVRVSQNAGDIDSASNSALGGTVRLAIADPNEELGLRASYTGGEHDLRRLFLRADSGPLVGGIASFLSYSDSRLRSWIGAGSGRFDRRHIDFKAVKAAGGTIAKFNASWSYRNENDYNSITLAEFRANPRSDRLLDVFQIESAAAWRPAWGATRWNKTAWLDLRHRSRQRPEFSFRIAPYLHRQKGWGWWVAPYRVATRNGRVQGRQGAREYYQGTFHRADNGALVAVRPTSVAHLPCLLDRYPDNMVDYALADSFDCAFAERVASRRRSGYWSTRFGLTAQAERSVGRHTLTVGGWVERQNRDNNRQWFDLDRRDPGTLDPAPADLHWTHFDRRFKNRTQRYYLQDRIDFGPLTWTAGLVYHTVETDYASRIDAIVRRQSRAEWLPKLGVVYAWRPGAELFASYSRNVSMLPDELLSSGATDRLRPERSDNFDAGVRWRGLRVGLAAHLFAQRFDGRLAAVESDQYLQGAIGVLNVGGVESRGVEVAVAFDFTHWLAAYTAYSHLDARYTDAVPAEGVVAGKRVVNSAKNQWFGELVLRPAPAWRLAVNAQFVGERPADLANADTIPAHTLIGASARFTLPALGGVENAMLQFNATNLANERYLSAPDADKGGAFFLGPARMLSLTARAHF